MSLLDRLGGALNGARGTGVMRGLDSTARVTQRAIAARGERLANPCDRYAVLRWYYSQNGLYDQLAKERYDAGIQMPAMKALRNPAYRIVEAHVQHLWPGDLPDALPIVTENQRILDPIQQIWRWSNWASNKQVMARWLALYGDVFVKVVRPTGTDGQVAPRVYFQLLDPAHVTDFDTDERGNLTYARIEVPQKRRAGDQTVCYLHVEIWSKAEQTYRRWEVDETRRELLDPERMPPADEEIPLTAMGIDFVPIAHCKFLDVGEPRGVAAFLLQLDKIDAVNADATRLAQLLFRHNKALWALHGMGNDAAGRPLPAPSLPINGTSGSDRDVLNLEDDSILRIPGAGELTPLVPNLQYEAHRLFNNDGLLDLQHDCPEMAYWKITEHQGGELSGRALRFMLAPFVKRVLEVRGNAEDCLARLDAMALTIGSAEPRLFGNVGAFDAGDFEHQFEARDVIPLSDQELAQADQLKADAAGKKLATGAWSQTRVLTDYGYSETEIEDIATQRAGQDSIVTEEQ